MPSKQKKTTVSEANKYPRKTIHCKQGDTVNETGRNYAKLITSAELAAYRVIETSQPKSFADGIDTPTMLATLRDQAAAVHGGDLAYAEAMLMNQATALQSIFVRLAESSFSASMLPQQETAMRLALKAQSQCRCTLETLAAIKNPPVVYARQANVTTGPQQVNNGTAALTRAREIETEQTQLSGGTHELLPDARASGFASRVNQEVEALGEIHRAEIPRR